MPNFFSPDAYWEMLEPHLRRFSPDEQRAAIALYRELAKGEAVDSARLATALGIPAAESAALLDRDAIKSAIYRDGQGRVLGFGGLAVAPMHHRLKVNGRTLSTWCAWDSLFLPELLESSAEVASPDPESGQLVQLVVTPERIASVEPRDTVMSFVRPDAGVFGTSATNVMAKFCHFIYFFASQASGERWSEKNPGTFLSSLDDAFVLAKRFNRRNFGLVLGLALAPPTL
jgi:alkylmercury lyase